MPKISVIVPVYNVEVFLKDCLDSLVNQTLNDIEIICINDGSTDNSLDILNDYAEKYKRIIVYSQENAGISSARNKGLELAKGEYISFVDSDDWISKDFYEKLYEKAASNKADIAAGNIEYYQEGKFIKDNYLSKKTFALDKNVISSINDKQKFTYSVVVWNKIYKRELIKNTGLKFPAGMKFEDNFFTFLIIFSASVIVTESSVTYYYRINKNSIMCTAFSTNAMFDIFKVLSETTKFVNQNTFPENIQNDIKKILDCYKINTLFSWLDGFVPDNFKDEFRAKTVEVFKNIDISNNSYATAKTKRRYNKVLGKKKSFFDFFKH